MLKIENILCPVDFSDCSAKAYQYAWSLASHYGSRLLVQHVIEPLALTYPYFTYPDVIDGVYKDMEADAEERLREMTGKISNEVRPELVVHTGIVGESILTFAAQKAADLIVMGTHGREGLSRMTMGSVAAKVLRNARCPVLAVRKPLHDFVSPANHEKAKSASDPVRLRKILFCADFSDTALHSLTYAFYLALEYQAELVLLHVIEHLTDAAQIEKETAAAMWEMKKPIPSITDKWCEIKPVVRVGKPYEQIVQTALEMEADLIVMGVRGRNVLDRALFGSTTERVILLGSCPVLAVHMGSRIES